MDKFFKVVIFKNLISLDILFTYRFSFDVSIGDFVIVDFNNSLEIALVIEEDNNIEDESKIKDAISKINELRPLSSSYIKLGMWMKKFYILTYAKAFSIISDTSSILNLKYINKKLSYTVISEDIDRFFKFNYSLENSLEKLSKNSTRQIELIKNSYKIYEENKYITYSDLKDISRNKATVDSILQKDILEEIPEPEWEINNDVVLTDEQQKVFDTIKDSDKNRFLINGVTGSGKTEIYFKLIESAIEKGNSAIFLVPEIALTSQMEKRTRDRFGNLVSIIHSKITPKKRRTEMERIKNNKSKVLLATRSGIFIDMPNLEYIIIDEEHDDSYKLDEHNKYDVREVARFIAEERDLKLILSSATPSIETYFKAQNGVYELLELKNRKDNDMPNINIVDMREELSQGNNTPFSMDLMVLMKSTFIRDRQALLFLNRRGHSQSVICRDCGFTVMCEKCDIPMVYHESKGYLECHYCGNIKPNTRRCPNCGSNRLKYMGIGTEKLENETKNLFPDQNVMRIDSDTTKAPDEYRNNVLEIMDNKVDIIVGTQMISKGFDFPNLLSVGVIAADMSLFFPDYDSAEKTFQMLMQVSGRSGRSKDQGEVIIQTYNPEHYAIKYAKEQDYIGFFNEELMLRKIFLYPPFVRQFKIDIINKNLDDGLKLSRKIIELIEDKFKNQGEDIEVISNKDKLGYRKINNRYFISIYLRSRVRHESIVKSFLYDIIMKNLFNLNFKNTHVDVVFR